VAELPSRCGYRCDLCLAYRPNVEARPEDRQTLSDGWHRYFGFRILPQDILCDGCRSEGQHLIDHACPVRPCVMERSLNDCSECGEYGCARLTERLVEFEEVEARVQHPIPEADRTRFIAPYENKIRLEALRRRGG
jgi:Protein of unknown function (DUF3795)